MSIESYSLPFHHLFVFHFLFPSPFVFPSWMNPKHFISHASHSISIIHCTSRDEPPELSKTMIVKIPTIWDLDDLSWILVTYLAIGRLTMWPWTARNERHHSLVWLHGRYSFLLSRLPPFPSTIFFLTSVSETPADLQCLNRPLLSSSGERSSNSCLFSPVIRPCSWDSDDEYLSIQIFDSLWDMSLTLICWCSSTFLSLIFPSIPTS